MLLWVPLLGLRVFLRPATFVLDALFPANSKPFALVVTVNLLTPPSLKPSVLLVAVLTPLALPGAKSQPSALLVAAVALLALAVANSKPFALVGVALASAALPRDALGRLELDIPFLPPPLDAVGLRTEVFILGVGGLIERD